MWCSGLTRACDAILLGSNPADDVEDAGVGTHCDEIGTHCDEIGTHCDDSVFFFFAECS